MCGRDDPKLQHHGVGSESTGKLAKEIHRMSILNTDLSRACSDLERFVRLASHRKSLI